MYSYINMTTKAGERKRRGNSGGGGREEAFAPPPFCSIISEASEAVCIPHTGSFNLPDANKVVCIPHTISFGLPDVNEQCATHTPLCLSFFIPPIIWGGFFLAMARMRWYEIDTLPHSSGFSFFAADDRGGVIPTCHLQFHPPIIGGNLLCSISNGGSVIPTHTAPVYPPIN